jgi:hypothetical protein
MKQHWEKEIDFKGNKYRIKKLTPFEFPAFKMVFAKATNDGDMEALAKVYENIANWLEISLAGVWIPVYDKQSGIFTVDSLNDLSTANQLLDIVLSDLILPLFTNTAE